MTYSTRELRELGVDELLIEWRRWRRRMKLTQPEAAAMAQVSETTLFHAELGKRRPQAATITKLRTLMERWHGAVVRWHWSHRKPERRGRWKKKGASHAA